MKFKDLSQNAIRTGLRVCYNDKERVWGTVFLRDNGSMRIIWDDGLFSTCMKSWIGLPGTWINDCDVLIDIDARPVYVHELLVGFP
jgi:hypothetical protein